MQGRRNLNSRSKRARPQAGFSRTLSEAIGRTGSPRRGCGPTFVWPGIERPIGWWLLLLPCWWSAALAAVAAGFPLPNVWHCILFLVGAVAMRGSGSTYNDIVDRDLDAGSSARACALCPPDRSA